MEVEKSGRQLSAEIPLRNTNEPSPIKPFVLCPKVKLNPKVNHNMLPNTNPDNVCISMLKLFFLRIIPAWAMPIAGVWSITNAVAAIIIAISPSFNSHSDMAFANFTLVT